MSPTDRRATPPRDPSHFRHSYSKDKAQLIRRLSRMEGQVRGIARMIEREEYCVDILQQTAALRAAVDALSVLVLEDHVSGCVRTAAEQGHADEYVDEVIDVVRRTLGRPVRGSLRRRPTHRRRGSRTRLSTNRPVVPRFVENPVDGDRRRP
jgi:CsoR family transcriptional regulator, copper-sensing transcriptional repressor